jgi:pyruvate,orthophosphate dikinase
MAKTLKKPSSKKVSTKVTKPTQKAASSKKTRYVFYFGDGKADGDGKMKPLLGGKGANLAEMTRIGLPVPPGFTITTEVCTYFYENKKSYPPELAAQVATALAKVEKSVRKGLGDRDNPLLLSVRSGARDSMPGMMDTILNLGMNDDVVEIVAEKSGNPRFAWDSYRRFLQMYGDVVMGVQKREG